MATQPALAPKSQSASNAPLLTEAEKLLDHLQTLSHNIAHRAFEFFQARGGQFGHALEDWVRAESELVRPVPVELTETDQRLVVRAETPGFQAHEIQVSVEPQRLIISGQAEHRTEEQVRQTLYTEQRARQFCRVLELPAAVDPAQTVATLKDGILELTLAKAATESPVQVAVKAA